VPLPSRRLRSLHQQKHQHGNGTLPGLLEKVLAGGFGLLLTHLHLVWGYVSLTGIAAAVV